MNVLVLGRRGLGKTTLALWKARQLNRHVIAWSPGAEFREFDADIHTTDLEALLDAIEEADDEENFLAEYVADGDLDANFTEFGQALWRWGNFVLIVDEANEIQTPGRINLTLSRYIRRAPRREKGEANPVDIISTCHFPVDLHRVSFGLGDEAYIFRLTRELDIDRIERELGPDVADAVNATRTPETSPAGRDVIHVNVTTRQFDVMTDPAEWNIKRDKQERYTYA